MKTVTTKQFTWQIAYANHQEDIDCLRDELKIDPEILTYVLDKNELARLEYDKTKQDLLVIYNALRDGTSLTYQTSPVSYFVSENQLVTVFGADTDYLLADFETILDKQDNLSLFEFVFTTMFTISKTYFPVLEGLNRERDDLNRKLRGKTTKQALLELSDLGTGLIYLVSASKQNALLLEQIQAQTFYKTFSDSELEQLEDAQIEARQLLEMTDLSAQIAEQLEGSYNNVLNNNLNDTMKVLTKLSILLTIPSIVTGFFGMNVGLPTLFTKNEPAWVWVIVLSVILWLALGVILEIYMDRGDKR